MTQHDFDVADQSFPAFRADMNLALKALASLSSGTTEPSTTFANQPWLDTSAVPWVLKVRNVANDAWIDLLQINDSDDTVSVAAKNLSATATILAAAGSLANVAIGRSTDVNTGVIFPAADQLGLVAGGVQSALIKPDSVDLAKAVSFSGVISPAQITANQNDYNPAGLANAAQLRLTSDTSRNITGLAGGAAGRAALVVNVGSSDIVLVNQSTGSAAANRFLFVDGDRTLTPDESVLMRYDATTARWRSAQDVVVAAPGGSGGMIGLQVFASTGTWTPNASATTALIIATGGGEAGQNDDVGVNGGAGGQAGETVMEFVADSTAVGTPSVTIGAGGTANGANGGDTLVGSLATAPGGGSATAAVGDVQIDGGAGDAGHIGTGKNGGIGGGSFWGGPGARGAGGDGSREGANNDGPGTAGFVVILEW